MIMGHSTPSHHRGRELAGFCAAGAGALLVLALASFDPRDYAERAFPVALEVRNLAGAAGRDVAGFLVDWLGILASYALAGAAILAGLSLARQRLPEAAPD